MRLYEITNCNKRYTFDLDSIDVLILGDGSLPVEKSTRVLVHCGNHDYTLLFENAKDAKSTYEYIKFSMLPPRR